MSDDRRSRPPSRSTGRPPGRSLGGRPTGGRPSGGGAGRGGPPSRSGSGGGYKGASGGGYKGGGDSRPPRRDDRGDDRRSFSSDSRPPRRDFGDRPPRRDDGFASSRPPRTPRDDSRPPRRDDDSRPPRRDDGGRPRKSFDRPAGDRPPRREEGERSFGDRPQRSAPPPSTRSYASRSFDNAAPRRENSKSASPRPERSFKGEGFAKKTYAAKPSSSRPAKYEDKPDGGAGALARQGHEHMLYGVHAVIAALKNTARDVKTIWVTETSQKHLQEAWDGKRHPSLTVVDRKEIDRLLPEGAVHQGLAIAVEPLPEIFLSDIITPLRQPNAKRQVIVMLDEVTDPHNVGAVMRSMAAFGATTLIVHKFNAPTITGVLAKTATGAVEHIPMLVARNLAEALEELQLAGCYILGLDEKATVKLTDVPRDRSIVLVMGAEGEGLRAKTRASCDAIAAIPSYGPIASLNVSNAAAIALYEVTRVA